MSPVIKAYDDAFRLVQQAMLCQDSMAGISLLTRVEFYLLGESRRELHNLLLYR